MKKILVRLVLAGASALLATPSFAQQGQASAVLHPAPGTGIRAEVLVLDTGDTLFFSGRAVGLTPGEVYASLLYDVDSEPGPFRQTPATLGACEPSTLPPPLPDQMFIGVWNVDAEGNGVLFGMNTGVTYTPLGTFDTISIRFPAPGVQNVQACGQVAAQISQLP
jgi:hypothetical protein